VGRNLQHLTGQNIDYLRFVRANPKSQRAFQDVGKLFVLV
jgi:hypothetical protein